MCLLCHAAVQLCPVSVIIVDLIFFSCLQFFVGGNWKCVSTLLLIFHVTEFFPSVMPTVSKYPFDLV